MSLLFVCYLAFLKLLFLPWCWRQITKRRMEPMVRRRRRRGSTTMGSRSESKDSSMAEVMTLGMAMDGLRKEKYRRAALPSSKPHLT